MDDIGAAIQNFLAQPGAMEQVESMAKQLGLGGEAAPESLPADAPARSQEALPGLPEGLSALSGLADGISPELLGSLMGALRENGDSGRSAALFEALRPLLRPQKQEKVDRAIQAVRLMHTAKTVSKVIGATEPNR